MITVVLGTIVIVGIIAFAVWYFDERTKYSMIANNMQMEGYTELEILEELGPPPKA